MADFFEYLEWRGDISINEIPLNAVDYLLLSHLTYANLDGLISDSFTESKTISQLAKDYKKSSDFELRNDVGVLINKRTGELLLKTAKCKRFKNIKVSGFRSIFKEDINEQFAALVFMADNLNIISYRGTDDTIVGWREDFDLAYMDEIPSQKDALKYFSDVTSELDGNFVIIGHSKGGNLAVNTSVKCGIDLQKRISEVYNFDGPGFSKDFFETEEYKNIEKKLYSFYPQFSVVGMIFDHPEKFKILKSSGFAIMEHDALTWQVLGRELVTVKDFDEASKAFHTAFNDWLYKLSREDKKKFVAALFAIIDASGAKTLQEINKNVLPATAKMLGAYTSMDKETKKEVKRIIGLFRDTVHSEFPLFKIVGLIK